MDLVTRIKNYMNSQNIGSSQFADACDIPRPTLSQILNGRNKKISDEIIRKIHQAYPDLSMLWLMFGEGDMLTRKNIEISEPQNDQFIDFRTPQGADIHDVMTEIPDSGTSAKKYAEKYDADNLFNSMDVLPGNDRDRSIDQAEIVSQARVQAKPAGAGISISPDNSKRIVNIMVFYSDNSFESFIPADSQQ